MAVEAASVARLERAGASEPLETAILRAVLYSDLFDQPLRPDEVHRFLPVAAELPAVRAALAAGRVAGGAVEVTDGFAHLAGRAALAAIRRRRTALAEERWRRARRYGRLIGALPFVRLVAVTGALAVDNVEAEDDVDLLVATAPGRLWLARALVLAVVLVARRRGLELCPNYFLATSALAQPERGIYAAREIVQMVPLYGRAAYHDFRAANVWVLAALPNARLRDPGPRLDDLGPLGRWKELAEGALAGPLGELLERVERSRKIRKLGSLKSQMSGRGSEATRDRSQFDADHCKGHFDDHGSRTRRRYVERLEAYGLRAES